MDRVCHNCEYAQNTHENDKGIPNCFCLKYNEKVIEFHEICEEFKEKEIA